jgi:hypothetical protein
MRHLFFTASLSAVCAVVCTVAGAATFSIPEAALNERLVFIAYGDMRFTDPGNTGASNPPARQFEISLEP